MPWRGPSYPGEFPSLGWSIGAWIEEHVVIPDGPQRGTPYLLTDEMWLHFVWCYRLHPNARVDPRFPRPADGFVYYGSQVRRPQKWGKDPKMAAKMIAHALGDVQFDGWDSGGEPVGRPVDTPWIQCAATSEKQTDNTFRPLVRMLREGPLINISGLDVGDTRVKLPNGDGWIEPVTAEMTSRLGAPITYAAFTEPHLYLASNGGVAMARAMKRNIAGMGGSWTEATNAWDPSQNSTAQQTAEAKRPGVFLDHRLPDLPPVDLSDEAAVRERIILKYGDSARSAGGWVVEERIHDDIRAADTGEAEARRYFLDEVTVGEADAVDATRWDAKARPRDLRQRQKIALGFDGSRSSDCTSIVASRIEDGRWFHIKTWDPAKCPDHRVPRAEVDQVLVDAFEAYDVWYLFGDPFKWTEWFEVWAARWPKRVVEFPTNNETKMDRAITRFQQLFKGDEFTHDGDPILGQHAKDSAIAKGKKKAPRPEDNDKLPEHYLRVVKKKATVHIDAFIAGLLAEVARGQAIEDGALTAKPAPATAPSAAGDGGPNQLYRPGQRLQI